MILNWNFFCGNNYLKQRIARRDLSKKEIKYLYGAENNELVEEIKEFNRVFKNDLQINYMVKFLRMKKF
jgi:hypothetical protein